MPWKIIADIIGLCFTGLFFLFGLYLIVSALFGRVEESHEIITEETDVRRFFIRREEAANWLEAINHPIVPHMWEAHAGLVPSRIVAIPNDGFTGWLVKVEYGPKL